MCFTFNLYIACYFCKKYLTNIINKKEISHGNHPRNNLDAMVKSRVDNGLRVVIRDSNGKILVAGVRKADQLWSLEMCEAAEALFVHLVGDALNVIRHISEAKEGTAPIFLFYEHIAKLNEVFSKSFVHMSVKLEIRWLMRWLFGLSRMLMIKSVQFVFPKD